jgi:DUF2934 family protein
MPTIPADAEERGRSIAKRAAELCEARSGIDGPDRADWMQAEREMAIVEAIMTAVAPAAVSRAEPAAVSNLTSASPREPDSTAAGAAPRR